MKGFELMWRARKNIKRFGSLDKRAMRWRGWNLAKNAQRKSSAWLHDWSSKTGRGIQS